MVRMQQSLISLLSPIAYILYAKSSPVNLQWEVYGWDQIGLLATACLALIHVHYGMINWVGPADRVE